MPKVSFLLSSYNPKPSRLFSCIDSCLLQHKFVDFDLVIVDDHSASPIENLLASKYTDTELRRMKIIRNSHNLGLGGSLNAGIQSIDAQYIARIDDDDINSPLRLHKQTEFFESNSNVSVLGSSVWAATNHYNYFNVVNDLKLPILRPYTDFSCALPRKPEATLIFHPTAMIPLKTFHYFGMYRQFRRCQDKELWLRILSMSGTIANLAEPLVIYYTASYKRSFRKQLSILKSRLSIYPKYYPSHVCIPSILRMTLLNFCRSWI